MHILKNLGHLLPSPMLHRDNKSALNIAKNPVFLHHHTKHIEIDVHFVREQVACGAINLAHVPRQDQVDFYEIFVQSQVHAKPKQSLCRANPTLSFEGQ